MSEFSIRTQPFRLGLADYRALWLAEFRRVLASPTAWLAFGIWFGAPLLLSLDDLHDGRYPTYMWVPLAVVAFCAVTGVAGLAFRWLRYRRDPVMIGERIMVLDNAAIRLIGDGYDVRQSWATANRVRQGRYHIYIHMNSSLIYTVPRRALLPGDAERLVTTLNAMIRATRRAPTFLSPLAEAPDARELWRCRPYRLTPGILFARLIKTLWTAVIFILGLAMLGLTVDVWLKGIDRFDGMGLVCAAVAVLVFIALGLGLGLLVVSRQKSAGMTRDMGFTRDYIRCTTAAFDVRVDWANVSSVHRIGAIFTFRFSTGRFDVPASAFATKAEAMAFFTQAVAFWRAAEARREG